jgi:hypothetical protein
MSFLCLSVLVGSCVGHGFDPAGRSFNALASSFVGVLIAFIAPVFAGVDPKIAFQILVAAIVTALFAGSLDVAGRPIVLGIVGSLLFGTSASLLTS